MVRDHFSKHQHHRWRPVSSAALSTISLNRMLASPSSPSHASNPNMLLRKARTARVQAVLILAVTISLVLLWAPVSGFPRLRSASLRNNLSPAEDAHANIDSASAAAVQRRRLQGVPDEKPSAAAPDSPVRLAFFVQISSSTLTHLPRLLRKIYEPQNVYAVHFDKKVDVAAVSTLWNELVKENPAYASNVHRMPAELITYRGVSMLLNTINAMQFLLQRADNWHFFINLSGSDYPLLSVSKQRALLGSASRSLNYFSLAPPEKWARNIRFRMANFYVDEALGFQGEGNTKVVQMPTKNPLAQAMKFRYANAEAWMINSREFCEYVVSSSSARKLLLTFAFSVESSEHYFSTLAWNSRFNSTIVKSALRQVIWSYNGRSAGQHPFYVDERDAQSGKFVFEEKVLGSVHFYTRKFKTPDHALMDKIDAQMDSDKVFQRAKRHFVWAVSVAKERAAEQPEHMPFE